MCSDYSRNIFFLENCPIIWIKRSLEEDVYLKTLHEAKKHETIGSATSCSLYCEYIEKYCKAYSYTISPFTCFTYKTVSSKFSSTRSNLNFYSKSLDSSAFSEFVSFLDYWVNPTTPSRFINFAGTSSDCDLEPPKS